MLARRQNLVVANAVLAALDVMNFETDMPDNFHCWVECYSNGREQGYCIQSNKLVTVAFSENRNSDNIVVYFGESTQFSMQGNSPCEEVYKNRKFFAWGEYQEAAKFIRKYFANPEKFLNKVPVLYRRTGWRNCPG